MSKKKIYYNLYDIVSIFFLRLEGNDGILAADHPVLVLLVHFLLNTLGKTDDYIGFTGPECYQARNILLTAERSDRFCEGGRGGPLTIVDQLAIVQIALEDPKIRFLHLREEILGRG